MKKDLIYSYALSLIQDFIPFHHLASPGVAGFPALAWHLYRCFHPQIQSLSALVLLPGILLSSLMCVQKRPI